MVHRWAIPLMIVSVSLTACDAGAPLAPHPGLGPPPVSVSTSDASNEPPSLVVPDDQVGHLGDWVELVVQATDPEGDELVFRAGGLPPGLVMQADGVIQGTIAERGVFDVVVVVEDSFGNAVFARFIWSVVNRPPEFIDSIEDVTTFVQEYMVMPLFVWDPDGDAMSTDAFGLPPGIESSPGYLEGAAAVAGEWLVRVEVTDGWDTTFAEFVWTVLPSNTPPVLDPLPGAELLAGESYSGTGSFTDPDTDVWSGTMDFGDGGGPVALVIEPDRTFSFAWTYATAGSYTVEVTISDGVATAVGHAAVTVLTAGQAIETLAAMVTDLVVGGSLDDGNGKALQTRLDAAQANTDRGNLKAAANTLNAFINHVDALVRAGRLDASAGVVLVAYAERIIAAL